MTTDGMPAGGVSVQTTTTAPPPEPTTTQVPSFLEMLPEEHRTSKWAENFSKAENPLHTLAKTYDNAEKEIGKLRNRVELPGEGATPEQVQQFRKALGVPDTPDAYELGAPDLSKESEVVQKLWAENADENFGAAMKAAAHELGLTPKQFAGMAEKLNAYNVNTIKGLAEAAAQHEAQQVKAEEEAFAKHFGDQSGQVVERAKQIVEKIGMPKEIAQMGEKSALIWMADYIHKNVFANDSITTQNLSAPGKTKVELRGEITKIRDTLNSMSKSDPNYAKTHARMMELYAEEAKTAS